MKNFLLISLILCCMQTFAQETNEQTPQQDGVDKIKLAQTIDALKVAYITKQLELTSEEAQKFWPIYNGFAVELKKAKVLHKEDEVSFEEKKVGIMKKYKEDFKKLLNNDSRVNKCFKVEPEFHKILKAEWVRRQGIRKQSHQQGKGMGGEMKPPQQPKTQQPPIHPNRNITSGAGGIRRHKG